MLFRLVFYLEPLSISVLYLRLKRYFRIYICSFNIDRY
jgi:hypothetical protein